MMGPRCRGKIPQKDRNKKLNARRILLFIFKYDESLQFLHEIGLLLFCQCYKLSLKFVGKDLPIYILTNLFGRSITKMNMSVTLIIK